jgi:methylated-DNA-[protein]-cysteine S-methyltransferase
MDCIQYYDSPLGRIMMAGSGEMLTGLWFTGQKYFAETLAAGYTEKEIPVLSGTKRWLDLYFGGTVPDFTPPLEMRGSAFRRAVWEILLSIPYGRTVTYGEIAGRIAGRNGAAQAVGGAVSHNPVSLIIPCHRVIGADGSLTGYAGGTDRKSCLLRMEQACAGANCIFSNNKL